MSASVEKEANKGKLSLLRPRNLVRSILGGSVLLGSASLAACDTPTSAAQTQASPSESSQASLISPSASASPAESAAPVVLDPKEVTLSNKDIPGDKAGLSQVTITTETPSASPAAEPAKPEPAASLGSKVVEAPSPAPVTAEQTPKEKLPFYKQIHIGDPEQVLIDMGFKMTGQGSDNRHIFDLESPKTPHSKDRPNEIQTQDGKVIYLRVIIPENKDEENFLTLQDLMAQYPMDPNKDHQLQGSNTYGLELYNIIYINEKNGYRFTGNAKTNVAYELILSKPMPFDDAYDKLFGEDYAKKVPANNSPKPSVAPSPAQPQQAKEPTAPATSKEPASPGLAKLESTPPKYASNFAIRYDKSTDMFTIGGNLKDPATMKAINDYLATFGLSYDQIRNKKAA
jgi:hypothetical protein